MMKPRPARTERGSATTQLVIVTPVLLFALMLVVQFALWQHASHVVTAAAQHGAEAAQAERGSTATGHAQASAFVSQAGSGVVVEPRVSVTRTGDTTRVEVSGHAVTLVPGFGLPVRGVAEGPNERFRSRLER